MYSVTMDLARDLPRSGSTGATESIERELTLLVRQAHKVHEHLEDSDQPLERPAYAILGVLHDLLSTWSAQDRSVFASLLQQLNADLDGRLDPRNGPSRRPAV